MYLDFMYIDLNEFAASYTSILFTWQLNLSTPNFLITYSNQSLFNSSSTDVGKQPKPPSILIFCHTYKFRYYIVILLMKWLLNRSNLYVSLILTKRIEYSLQWMISLEMGTVGRCNKSSNQTKRYTTILILTSFDGLAVRLFGWNETVLLLWQGLDYS